jgi:hypothetical protein
MTTIFSKEYSATVAIPFFALYIEAWFCNVYTESLASLNSSTENPSRL